RRGSVNQTAARDYVAANRVRDHVVTEQAGEKPAERSRPETDRAGIVNGAVAVDLNERPSRGRRGNPDVGERAQQQENDDGRDPSKPNPEIRAQDGADA